MFTKRPLLLEAAEVSTVLLSFGGAWSSASTSARRFPARPGSEPTSSDWPSACPDSRPTTASPTSRLRSRSATRRGPGRRTSGLVDRRIPVRVLNAAWNRFGWPPIDRLVDRTLDLVHSPTPLLVPARRGRRIVTLHDLFFFKHPELVEGETRRDFVTLVRDHVEARRRRHLRLGVHRLRGAAPARRPRREDRGDPARGRPAVPRDPARRAGGRVAAAAAPAARRHPVRRQRREAQEPRHAGDGLHDARPPPAAAPARARGPRLRLGAGRQPRRPADRGDRLPRPRRRARADGGLRDAGAALARGRLRPAGRRGDGRRPAGRVLARLGARRGAPATPRASSTRTT